MNTEKRIQDRHEGTKAYRHEGNASSVFSSVPSCPRAFVPFSLFICGSLFLLPLAGCNETVKPPIQGRNDPYQLSQVHFASDALRRATAVGQPMVARDDAGNLFVTIPIRSAIDKTLFVDYRVTFFDQNGQPINSTSWFTKTLEQNTPDRITVNSTSPRAADFQVDFRFAR